MTDQDLMQKIFQEYGAAIGEQPQSGIVPSFLAALVANESGGEPNARRFEKNVLADLWEILLGRKQFFGSISAATLSKFLTDDPPDRGPLSLTNENRIATTLKRLDDLATSWGLTQIMGWHTLEYWWKNTPGWYQGIEDLKTPRSNLVIARALLKRFAVDQNVPLTDFSALFHCWNSGRKTGNTFDPQYVPRGLGRMRIYERISSSDTDKPEGTK